MPAASASFSTTHGRSVARESSVAARAPIHLGSIWVAVCTTPFVTTAGSVQPIAPALEDYALLGDRRTAALVSRAGSVDWWCAPRFDAPACFAALLGTADHGRFSIAPTDGVVRTIRRYRPGTMVLETEHETASGRVRVVDFLALGRSRPLLVRLVEGV